MNLERRFKRWAGEVKNPGLVSVFYGSKPHLREWEQSIRKMNAHLSGRLPGVPIESAYAGDAVDFSPLPLADCLTRRARNCSRIVVLPALVSLGVIQTQVIPQAVQMSGVSERVIDAGDSILPDSDLAKQVWQHALTFAERIDPQA